MNFNSFKLELFYLRKTIFQYGSFFKYLKSRSAAKKILKQDKVLEKEINNNELSIHILCGKDHLVMLLWSLKSFYEVMTEIGELFIHNDGTLGSREQKILKKFFPNCCIVGQNEVLKSNDFNKFNLIKIFRKKQKYFLLKKLVDPYFVSTKKFHLIVDSDLLWFKGPIEIEQEIRSAGRNSLMMQGVGVNKKFNVHFKNNETLDNSLAVLNSGIVFYNKDNFELTKLEEYFERLDESYKLNSHFIEQAGYAYCLKNLKALDEKKYTIENVVNQQTVARHYTSPKRALFYIEGITKIKNKKL